MIELLESKELVSIRETRSASRLSTAAAADVSAIALTIGNSVLDQFNGGNKFRTTKAA